MSFGNEEMERLLSEIQDGNHFAFSRLFDLYKSKIHNFAIKFVLTEDNADEVTQIVFVKLWEKRKKINISTSLDSYLYVLTKHTCFDFLRKVGNDKKLLGDFLAAYKFYPNEVEESLSHKEMVTLAEDIISKLPPRQKEVYIMSVVDKKSYDEIASAMNISKNTVKTQLKLARIFVKKKVPTIGDTTICALLISLLLKNHPYL